MRITIVQTDIKWDSPEENIISAEALLGGAPPSGLYVMPEMWATGFGAPFPHCREPLEWMRRTAAIRQCAICGSLAALAADETLRNRFYFVKPDGEFDYYDKRHLFTYGGENKHYAPGERRVVVGYKGIRFLLLTCYDLRFPYGRATVATTMP